jgi:chaperonin GroEL (HSP60 family)
VLARAIAREGFQIVAAGLNPNDLRRGIQLAVDTVVKQLGSISKKVTDTEIQQACPAQCVVIALMEHRSPPSPPMAMSPSASLLPTECAALAAMVS